MAKFSRVLLRLVLVCAALTARADVKLPGLFSDNMVLQQGMRAPVWGRADDGERVTVTFRGKKDSATARNGKWRVELPGQKAGGPDTLIVEGKNRIELQNVLVGEVWICSGQSNMEFPLNRSFESENDIAHSANPHLRLITVPKSVHRSEVEGQRARGRCQSELGGVQPGHGQKFFRRGLLFWPRPAKGARCAGRVDSHFLGRLAGGGLDEREGPRRQSRIQKSDPRRLPDGAEKLSGGAGKIPEGGSRIEKRGQNHGAQAAAAAVLEADRALRRHDCAVDSLRDQRRPLVSGRIECRSRLAVSRLVCGPDPQLGTAPVCRARQAPAIRWAPRSP